MSISSWRSLLPCKRSWCNSFFILSKVFCISSISSCLRSLILLYIECDLKVVIALQSLHCQTQRKRPFLRADTCYSKVNWSPPRASSQKAWFHTRLIGFSYCNHWRTHRIFWIEWYDAAFLLLPSFHALLSV
jgi:hypothetical protein